MHCEEPDMSEPAFIVGNGPSLANTNLDLLVGKTSFGMNRIQLHFGKPGCEQWRPQHYVFVDYQTTLSHSLVMEELAAFIRSDVEVYLGTELYDRTYNKLKSPAVMPSNLHFLEMCSRHFGGDYLSPSAPKRWHLDEEPKWCKFASGLFVAMQIAADQGHSPLVLIGCDLGYTPIHDDGHDPNHMDGEYVKMYPGRGVTPKSVMPPGYAEYTNAKLRYGHRVALKSCQELGMEVLNATVDGELEVYPRVLLEDMV
jgi:hypothetical protein